MTERRDEDGAFAATVAPDAHADLALARTIASTDPALARTVAASGSSAVQAGARDPSTLTGEHPGRYERKDEIGRGGMGRVVLVRDTHLGRDVALKELLSQGP